MEDWEKTACQKDNGLASILSLSHEHRASEA